MINLTEKAPDLIKMEIKMHLPQPHIIRFLQSKGYEIKGFPIHYPAEQGFLLDETEHTWHTFTATKEGEEQCRENHFLNVFKREVKQLLNEI